jgi:hypothetical protein
MHVCADSILTLHSSAWASIGQAVDIQYVLTTGNVTGVSETPIPNIEGYGVATITGQPASAIIWPVPSGCSTGQPDWSRVSDPDTVAVDGTGFAVRPEVLVFHTTSTLLPGCHRVSGVAALNALYRRVMIDTIASFEFLGALNEVSVGVREACPGTTGGTNCDTARANLALLNADRPGTAGTANFTTQLVTLRTDKCAFQAAQGWGPCP